MVGLEFYVLKINFIVVFKMDWVGVREVAGVLLGDSIR